ncbi:MAG TPA: hypothetical protein PLL77_13705 [Pyrinomonadaceae bacterium]|nr:hypothetical protein [Pyrinomonadaceae bacterium]
MKLRALLFVIITFSLAAVSAAAQTDKSFTREGLTFNYPSGWAITEGVDANADQLNFSRADLDVQLTVNVFKTPLNTPEKLAEAKKVLVDRYIEQTVKSFADAGGKPVSKPATSEISGVVSQGVSVSASLDGVSGAIFIQTAVVSERMVVMTLLGPAADVKKATATWDMIRTTMKIEPPPTPTPVATPTAKKP